MPGTRPREQLREHEDALIGLISEDAVAAALPAATEYVSEALRRRGCERGGVEEREAGKLLTMAQNAYQRRDYALCCYRLRRAALVAAGRIPWPESLGVQVEPRRP